MSNDNLDKGVVPAVDSTSTTEPDGKGTMATAKAAFPANAKQKATRRYAKKSLRKAARFIEKATQTLESTPALNKAALPKIGRAGSVTVQNATFDSDEGTNPNPTTKLGYSKETTLFNYSDVDGKVPHIKITYSNKDGNNDFKVTVTARQQLDTKASVFKTANANIKEMNSQMILESKTGYGPKTKLIERQLLDFKNQRDINNASLDALSQKISNN